MRRTGLLLGCVLGLGVAGAGCAELAQLQHVIEAEAALGGKDQRPTVKVSSIKLVHAPSESALGIYYCRELAKEELGELGALDCGALGDPPSKKDLEFVFDVAVEAQNPSPIPLPLVQMMLAFTAFPDRKAGGGRDNLGALCLSMCKDAHDCDQQADACKTTELAIHDLGSFEGAASNFLVSVALGEKRFQDLQIQTLPPHQTLHFNTRLALDVDQMTNLVVTVAKDAFAGVKHKKTPRLVIPYQLEGAAWVTVKDIGRIGANIPTLRGQWDLENP
jgi:hypothetical protein